MMHYRENTGYKILTSKGFKNFEGIRRTTKSKVLSITLEDSSVLKCSEDHKFFIDTDIVIAKNLKSGDKLTGTVKITHINLENYSEFLYDPVEVEDGNEYLSDNRVSSHNCDFTTSGNTFLEPDTLNWYQLNTVREPLERRDIGQSYWLWDYPNTTCTYLILADVARGDGGDFSTFHVVEVDTMTQVAEYKDQISTKDFARKLVSVAIEWNNAMLVVENANIGWDVVTTIQEMGYPGLYYSPRSEIIGTQIELYIEKFDKGDGMVPGFSMNQRTRPLVLEKARSFLEEKSVIIRSQRLLDEYRVFIWKNGKAQALQSYNDDLVMSFSMGLFLRDTAIRFRQTATDLAYASLNNYTRTSEGFQVYNTNPANNHDNPWQIQVGDRSEDIYWLLG